MAIKIGDKNHDIDLSKIPYLSAFVDFQARAQPQLTEFIHGPIPLFDVALKGVESGYRHCFRALSTNLTQYHTLCNTYDFLCVDILGELTIDNIKYELTIDDIKFDLKRAKINEDRCGMPLYDDYRVSRNAAFRLLYLILLGEFKDEVKDSVKIFSAVRFVVSDHKRFMWKTRKIVRAAYEDRFVSSAKQRASLDRSAKTSPVNLSAEYYSDVSTELWWSEPPEYDYATDDSDF
ncbi:hypothetical protein VE02_09545 [Pseudogymnoascus sp. 03VT05]|nr:hypothetical protein VE02_09545 [Pseudogymnoascus sp. 03VT05]